ncbi:MAG: glucan 1,4-alpha-glucosidase [Phycisphaerae bacterium]
MKHSESVTTMTLEHISRIETSAPGAPGIAARWTSSAKTGVGTALGNKSHVWFTLSHGIVNEVYYPRIDQACIRDMGFIVTDGAGFFSEEKRDTHSTVHWQAEGVPAFRMTNTCRAGRYRIEKEILSDPHHNTLLQHVRFIPQQGDLASYHLHVLLAPHLQNHGNDNTAWVGEFEGTPMLFARRDGIALALACSAPWLKRSVGYVGTSDGWQDLKAHNQMTWEYTQAEHGNVSLVAEIGMLKSHGDVILALGFGDSPEDAARSALGSLEDGFEKAKHDYITGWREWMKTHGALHKSGVGPGDLFQKSIAVLRTHETKTPPGGFIASLSIPWGFSQGDKDISGYHLVWARDMVETAGGLLAAGAHEDARRVLHYLHTTQQPDGHWPQNMWADGTPYWKGIQMDETALPILLVDLARRENALTDADVAHFWPMVRQAARYLVRNGPVSQQDRWEEDPGYTPFTVAAEIAALLAAAEMAECNQEADIASYLRETADTWNDCIERWMYASDTPWCREYQVDGYYVRIAPRETGLRASRFEKKVHVKNVADAQDSRAAAELISPDALALVRFGLRAADDPRIGNTTKIIDALLKIETPAGDTWHRYNDDGYGEHADGAPFDGTGIGRGWPLLTGERAHFELAAGREKNAQRLLAALESFADASGLIPEQVWDSPDMPERELHFGRPSGSAMPLVWAHAEYLKLRRSLQDGHVFDMPPQTVQRYIKDKTVSTRMIWRFNNKLHSMPGGKILRIETTSPAIIHWSTDNWTTTADIKTHDVVLGMHLADLPTQNLPEGKLVAFTFYWPQADHWEGTDFSVHIGALPEAKGQNLEEIETHWRAGKRPRAL